MKRFLAGFLILLGCLAWMATTAEAGAGPKVLSMKDRIATVNRTVAMRLERLLPQAMRETGFDMWVILCNEDNPDPVFQTMIPYDAWTPITQILVFYDPGAGKEIERLNLSRTNMRGLYKDMWDFNAWVNDKKESQWDCLARIIRERNPKTIGVNEGEIQWAAGGLTVPLKKKMVEAIGETFASRLKSAEPLATRWLETFLDEELDVYAHVVAVAHDLVARTMSSAAITPGVTTVDEANYFYWQQVADLGLDISFTPNCTVRGRSPQDASKFGKDDRVIRRGDLVHCDVGIKYMRYNTDHQEWAYILRVGESEAPESAKKALLEANRLQDVYAGQFKVGLTGNQMLTNILAAAKAQGIMKPRVYSHSLGYFLHEPGPLIGLPWEQVSNPGRGDVALVDNSCFTAELSATVPIPEWGGQELRMAVEQDVAFTKGKVHFIDGRQTAFHLVR